MGRDFLTLFPPYGIDQTIHVSILIGVLLALAMTEWFGWTFSGLVVPGYVASLFIVQPVSAGTVVFEALLTYFVARAISSLVSRSGAWSSFFGRERFLLLVFVSIAVRQACELWLVPDLLRFSDDHFHTEYYANHNFSSVGLVLVPLTSNMFWKVGLRRGLFQAAVPTLIAFAIVKFVLLPYTNLSFARLEITYENVALDFLGSPKAYILLVTGSYLASRYNLMYGWDYAGILVPALLGIAWFAPMRLATTLVETVVLVIVVRGIVWLPGIRTMNLEGPRKVAVVFATSFFLKYTLDWIIGPYLTDYRPTDLFGFGYLLSSLLAVKILQKDNVPQIIMPTFAVSVLTLVAGSAIGFGFDNLAPAPDPPLPVIAEQPTTPTVTLVRTPLGVSALGHVRARLDESTDVPLERSTYELDRYEALWTSIGEWIGGGSKKAVDDRLAELKLTLLPIGNLGKRPAFGMFEREERLANQVGWDTAVLVPGAHGPIIAVPRPASEAPTAEAAVALCPRIDCRAIVISGIDTDRRVNELPHGVARRALTAAIAKVPTLELLGDDAILRSHATLHVASDTPDVDLAALWSGTPDLSFEAPPNDHARWGASSLRANPADLAKVVADTVPATAVQKDLAIEAWFSRFLQRADLLKQAKVVHQTPSDQDPFAVALVAQAPSPSEVRFFEILVARPALAGDLPFAHAMGSVIGYSVRTLADGLGPNSPAWVLAESPRRLGWGVLAGRPVRPVIPGRESVVLEVPRPRRESGTGRLGVELWRLLDADALLVTDPEVKDDRADADPAGPWTNATAFQALHQAVHDRARVVPGSSILQVRGYSTTEPFDDPVIVTLPRPVLAKDSAPEKVVALVKKLPLPSWAAETTRYYGGGQDLIDLAAVGNPQLQYCIQFERVDCAMLWFSDAVRDTYREADRDRELAKLSRMGVPALPTSATAALALPPLGAPDAAIAKRLRVRAGELAKTLETYAREENVQLLRVLMAAAKPVVVPKAAPGPWPIDVHGGFADELGRPYILVRIREADHELRMLAFEPAGTSRVELDASAATTRKLPSVIASRPLLVSLVGRLPEPPAAPAPTKTAPAKGGARGR